MWIKAKSKAKLKPKLKIKVFWKDVLLDIKLLIYIIYVLLGRTVKYKKKAVCYDQLVEYFERFSLRGY